MSKKTTKTNTKQTKQTNTPQQTRKNRIVARKNRVELTTQNADRWFKSNKARPTDFVVHFTRTSNGYRIRAVDARVRRNQYLTDSIPIDVNSIVPDMRRMGVMDVTV